MRRAIAASLLAISLTGSPAHALGPQADTFQVGAYGGVGPSEPLYNYYLVGGWAGVGISEALRLEISGSFQDGLEQPSELLGFLHDESLLEIDDPIADRTLWTAEAVLRLEPLRGKLGLLQATVGDVAAHVGLGAGVRALETGAGEGYMAPAATMAGGVDLRLGGWLVLRLDLRGFGIWRRDDTVGLGAELLLGLGVHG